MTDAAFPEIAPVLIHAHVELIHKLAMPLAGRGKVVVTGFGEVPGEPGLEPPEPARRLLPLVYQPKVGDVQQTLYDIAEFVKTPHYNLYMPLAVYGLDLGRRQKGSEKDVLACLGLVADFDDADAARWAERLVRVAKPWTAGSTTPLQALSDALPEIAQTTSTLKATSATTSAKAASTSAASRTGGDRKPAKHQQQHQAAVAGTPENLDAIARTASLPPELQEAIRRPASGDRSKALFRVIAKLIEEDLDDATIENIIRAHPDGIGEKYADRDDLDREIARVRTKTTTRPVVQVRAGALPLVVDEAERHLVESDPNIFQRGSLIVRPAQEFIPTLNGRQITGIRLVSVGVHHLLERFSRVVDFQKLDRRSNTWFPVDCPKQVAEVYLGREGDWKLPILTRVITAPTLRADGSVIEDPGYDEATGLLFEANGVTFSRVPASPNILEDVVGAAQTLLGLLENFPFVDAASRAVALSAILTALIRASLPSAPLHAFTAPVRGSGKSLLVDLASMIASGHEAPVIAQGHTAEELEKRLGACFLAGDATIAIDNCERPLEGEFLCQVLTQPRVTIRELGHSRKVVTPTNASLFATGNNLHIKGDLTRRAIVCSLDPQCERPELREFPANPLDMIRQDRARYVAAALTILRYAANGELPEWCTRKPLGSFEAWSRWVRAAAIYLTDADPCDTMERAQAQDPEVEHLASVIHQWDAVIGDRLVTTSDVIEIATKQNTLVVADGKRFVHDTFREALLAVAGQGGAIDSRRLGTWLGRNQDRIVDGKKITMGPMSNGFNQWRVSTAEEVRLREAA